MSGYEPAPGDYVRVTREGKVETVSGVDFLLGNNWFRFDDPCITVEDLPDPEPEWHYGHVVKDGNGGYWWYTGGGWQGMFGGDGITENVSDDYPLRPLTVISVPNGDES